MRRLLSFTSALVSFVALTDSAAFAADVKSGNIDSVQSSSAVPGVKKDSSMVGQDNPTNSTKMAVGSESSSTNAVGSGSNSTNAVGSGSNSMNAVGSGSNSMGSSVKEPGYGSSSSPKSNQGMAIGSKSNNVGSGTNAKSNSMNSKSINANTKKSASVSSASNSSAVGSADPCLTNPESNLCKRVQARRAAGTGVSNVNGKTSKRSIPVKEDDGRPTIYVSGLLDTHYYYASPDSVYKRGGAFGNIGNADASKMVLNVDRTPLASAGSAPQASAGSAPQIPLTNFYNPTRITPGGNVFDHSKSWGVDADALVQLRINGQNKNTGIGYGAVASLALRNIKFDNLGPYNTSGTYAYVYSSIGNLSFGYREGPESYMMINASDIAVGDKGYGSHWYDYVDVSGRDGSSLFLLRPGLYTESFFNGTNGAGQYVNRYNYLVNRQIDVNSSLPIRISYDSPSFAGFKLGVSYAPRYNPDGFTYDYSGGFSNLSGGLNVNLFPNTLKSSIAPYYKNIFSGGISYSYSSSGIDFGAALVGETGTSVKPTDDVANGNLYDTFYVGKDLRAFGVGAKIGYMGADFVASFGNLFTSGTLSDVYEYNGIPGKNGAQMQQVDMSSCSSSSGLYPCNYVSNKSTTYFSLGAGYKYQDAYVSAMFFRSKSYNDNDFRYVSVGGEYNLAYGKSVFAPYVTWNYFWTKQSSILDVYQNDGSGVGNRSQLNGFTPYQLDNKGYVVLAGVRFMFS